MTKGIGRWLPRLKFSGVGGCILKETSNCKGTYIKRWHLNCQVLNQKLSVLNRKSYVTYTGIVWYPVTPPLKSIPKTLPLYGNSHKNEKFYDTLIAAI